MHTCERTAGYGSDLSYTYGYYSELDPLRAQLALLFSGQVVGPISSACDWGLAKASASMSMQPRRLLSGTAPTSIQVRRLSRAKLLKRRVRAQSCVTKPLRSSATGHLPDFDSALGRAV